VLSLASAEPIQAKLRLVTNLAIYHSWHGGT
jgi:hypothetical protein